MPSHKLRVRAAVTFAASTLATWVVVARKLRAKALVFVGFAAVTAGAWDSAGRARALVVGGILAVVFALLLVDVDAR